MQAGSSWVRIGVLVGSVGGCGPVTQGGGDGTDSGIASDGNGTDGNGTDGLGTGSSSSTTGDLDPPRQGTCPAPSFPGAQPVPETQMASTLAAEYCIATVECDCAERSHEDVPSCRHGENMSWEDVRERAQALDLAYDGACLGQLVAGLRALGCGHDTAGYETLLGRGGCAVYFGDGEIGDPCETVGGGVSSCAQGLACWEGTCKDPCAAPATERPRPFNFGCAPGELARYDDCRPPTKLGEECVAGDCEPGAYCQQLPPPPDCDFECSSSVCASRVPLGDPCDLDDACETGFCATSTGTCVDPPLTGDPCVDGRCADHRSCDDGVCGDPEPAICALTP